MVKILTIEDDETTAGEIVAELERGGFSVDWAADGREGLGRAMSGEYDAITLDRMLPHVDGLTIVTEMRSAGIHTPVLMVSALTDVNDRVKGLRAGGDDYMIKPFASEELSARLEVLLRRQKAAARSAVIVVGDLEIDPLSRVVKRAGVEVRLLPAEYKLLEYMARNSGQILTRTMIFEAVWGYHFDPGTNLIDVHLGRLRRKIDAGSLPSLIHTVRGSGYVLRAPA
jgi:two-component system OmpR family response regulator